jgi:Mrp family chromosome partitioning ATPase
VARAIKERRGNGAERAAPPVEDSDQNHPFEPTLITAEMPPRPARSPFHEPVEQHVASETKPLEAEMLPRPEPRPVHEPEEERLASETKPLEAEMLPRPEPRPVHEPVEERLASATKHVKAEMPPLPVREPEEEHMASETKPVKAEMPPRPQPRPVLEPKEEHLASETKPVKAEMPRPEPRPVHEPTEEHLASETKQVKAEFLESINEALSPRQTLPGFADPRMEHVSSIDLPPWFIDRCRQAYLSVAFDPAAGSRILGITSASYGEGKTSVAIGTATAMAVDTNKPTLLMECDFAEPTLYRFLGIDRGRGLSEWLDSGTRLRIVRGAALVPNLFVIPAGGAQSEPARFLFDLVDREVLLGLRDTFANIVIDLPPALTISYGSLAYALADHILIVVRSGVTVTDDLQRMVSQIGRDRVSGIVINGTDSKTPAWLRALL